MVGNVLTKESFQTIQLTEKGLNFFDLAIRVLSVSTAYQTPDIWYILSLAKLYAMGCNIDVKITRKQTGTFLFTKLWNVLFFRSSNFPHVCNEEEFTDIPKDILIHFISSEHLHVDSEYQVITVFVVVLVVVVGV